MKVAAAALFAALFMTGARAEANGAFPDSIQVLLPAGHPHQIILATNFGLVVSNDDGANFDFVCEAAIASYVSMYALGPGPGDRLYAVTPSGIRYSSDGACTWSSSTGDLAGPTDLFVDASDATHLFAIGTERTDGNVNAAGLYESHDSGASFPGPPVYSTVPGQGLTGIEISRSNPSIVYLARFQNAPADPAILSSSDAGKTFVEHEEGGTLTDLLRIAEVDPQNPLKLFLRSSASAPNNNDSLVVSEDGGQTVSVRQALQGRMSAFLHSVSGAIYFGGLIINDDGTIGNSEAYKSTDGGKTFTPWTTAPRLRALAERDQKIYAAGDNFKDHFALGVSSDNGVSFQPLVRFDQIRGPMACGDLPTTCATPWASISSLFGIADAGLADAGATTPKSSGCDYARDSGSSWPFLGGLGLLLSVIGLVWLLGSKRSRLP